MKYVKYFHQFRQSAHVRIRALYNNVGKSLHPRSKQMLYGIFGMLLSLAAVTLVRPVFAQGMVADMLELLKEKIGFIYSTDPTKYVFSRDTPNYRAFAGAVDPIAGHRIRLERDDASIELSFLSAFVPGQSSTQSVLGDVAKLTALEQLTLDTAEEILLNEASMSAQGRKPLPAGFELTPDERLIIASAAGILDAFALVPGSPEPSSSASGSAELSGAGQVAQDFALLLRLKSFTISQLSLDVDLKLAEISKDVSSITSQATLVDEPLERKVVFPDIALGMNLEYRLHEAGIKQQFVLNSREKIYDTYLFTITHRGLSSRMVGKGVWLFTTPDNTDVMRIPRGWARDANGKFTNNVEISLEKLQDVGDVLKVKVSPEWLTAPERVFPIVIDTALEIVPEMREGHPNYKKPRHLLTPTPPADSTPTAAPTITPTTQSAVTSTPSASSSVVEQPAVESTQAVATSPADMIPTPTIRETPVPAEASTSAVPVASESAIQP